MNPNPHKFHIPVMGLAFTIDSLPEATTVDEPALQFLQKEKKPDLVLSKNSP